MRKAIFLFISFLFTRALVFAQQTITGKVVDTNGLPLAGVSVKSKKTGKGVETASDGTLRLQASAGEMLEISSVGYIDQTIAASTGGIMNVTMALSISELNQVVLVGTRR